MRQFYFFMLSTYTGFLINVYFEYTPFYYKDNMGMNCFNLLSLVILNSAYFNLYLQYRHRKANEQTVFLTL